MKIRAVFLIALLLIIAVNINTYAAEDIQPDVLFIYENSEEAEAVLPLIEANGHKSIAVSAKVLEAPVIEQYNYVITTSPIPLEQLSGKKVVCLGNRFGSADGIRLRSFEKARYVIDYKNFSQLSRFAEQISVIDEDTQDDAGCVIIEEKSYPFSIEKNNITYVPFYKLNDLTILALGDVLHEFLGAQDGAMYVLIDEVYAFSDLEMLCRLADSFYLNSIPFIARIMPIYDNLEYPAFQRFAQVLRYVQARNGSIVLHDPLVIEREMEREPLANKMERLTTALDTNLVHVFPMDTEPYIVPSETLLNIESSRKNFGNVLFNCMVKINMPRTEEEYDAVIDFVNKKWLSVADYKRWTTDSNYFYDESPVEDDYVYYEEEEQSMVQFFATSNQLLSVIVGISVLIFIFFIILGRRLYRDKFY